jgi:transcription elongation factor Elf1
VIEATVTCPFCGSEDVELVSAWGGQIITSQLKCRRCKAYFEAVREDFDSRHDTDPPSWTTS